MEIVKLVHQHGVAHLIVGKTCTECHRGAFASKLIHQGSLILSVPDALTINVSDDGKGQIYSLARKLWLTEPDLKTRLKPYFDSLPPTADVLSCEAFDDAMLAELQSPHLAEGVKKFNDKIRLNFTNLLEEIKASEIKASGAQQHTLSEFLYLSSILSTRTFSFMNTGERLVPVGDMFNMVGYGPRSEINLRYPVFNEETKTFDFRASRGISAGEEVKFATYGPHVLKADLSLLIYGFVDDAILELDNPQVCVSDLPSYSSEWIWAGGDQSDSYREAAWTLVQKMDAIEWFSDRLKEAEARETIDDALLTLGNSSGWKREVIKFRVLRKRALAAAVERLKESIQLAVVLYTNLALYFIYRLHHEIDQSFRKD